MPSYNSFKIKNNSNRQIKKEEGKEQNKSNNFSNNNNSRPFIISSSSSMDLTNTNSSTADNYPKSIECNIDTNIELENIKTENEKDMLEILFNKQKELYKKQLANSENKMKNIYEIEEPFDGYRIFMLSSALVHEAIELQRETNWKWWKKEKSIDEQKIQEEIIDIWHFLLQLTIEAGIDSKKLIETYLKKNKENLNRQEKGY
jgi:dimeric dUTPase (all-alpha-NTP-PPase superfamily)